MLPLRSSVGGIPLLRFHPYPSQCRSVGQTIGLTAYPPQRAAIFNTPTASLCPSKLQSKQRKRRKIRSECLEPQRGHVWHVGFGNRADFHTILFSRPLEPVCDMFVAPVIVDHHVSLSPMIIVVSDSCEFTDNNCCHALTVDVLDELPSECGYRMPEAFSSNSIELGELL